jgi:hypothetical protein
MIFATGKGIFADLGFTQEGEGFVQFTETSGDEEVVERVEMPSFDDLDSSWNFVYMSHDEETSETNVYVFFSRSR